MEKKSGNSKSLSYQYMDEGSKSSLEVQKQNKGNPYAIASK